MAHQIDKDALRKIKTISSKDRLLVFLENKDQKNAGNVTISWEDFQSLFPNFSFSAGTGINISVSPTDVVTITNTMPQLWFVGTGINSRFLGTSISINPTGSHAVDAGHQNNLTGDYSFTMGTFNRISGEYSGAFGIDNDCTEAQSYCIGAEGIAFRKGQIVMAADSHTGANGHYSQTSVLHPLGATNNATPALLRLYYLDLISIPQNSIAHFEGSITAIQRAGSAGTVGDAAVFVFKGTIKNIGGTTALMGDVIYQLADGTWTTTPSTFTNDAGASLWGVLITANNTTDSLDISVTGELNKTIWWTCSLKLNETNLI